MKKIIFFSILLISNCQAQEVMTQSSPISNSLLKSITIQNEIIRSYYFYGETKLDTPYALQIPFKDLNDAEVLKGYKNYKLFNSASNSVYSLQLLVLLNNQKTFAYDPKKLIYLYGATVITSFIIKSIGRQKLKKAVNRFNSLLTP